MPSIILILFDSLLTAWEVYRIKTDFKNNKKIKGLVDFILTGQASRIGQFLSGITTVMVGIVVFLCQNRAK